MVETRHVKVDYEEAVASKRDLLNLQIDLLYCLKHLSAYKLLRKQENLYSEELKDKLSALKTDLVSIQGTFPDEFKNKIKKQIKSMHQKKEDDPDTKIKKELEDIKQKLDKLNRL